MVCEIGEKFGRLTVVGEASRRSGQRYVECVCACEDSAEKVVDQVRYMKERIDEELASDKPWDEEAEIVEQAEVSE